MSTDTGDTTPRTGSGLGKMSVLLSKKVGGIPVYLFALVVGAGMLWYAIRTPAAPADSTDTGDMGDTGDGTDTEGDLLPEGQPVFIANPTPPPTTDGTPHPTNDEWRTTAIAWLQNNRHVPATQAVLTIDRYLAGERLTFEQGQWRDAAIQALGLPPNPPQMGDVKPYTGPFVRQGEPPLKHTVMGKSDDTPSSLAYGYYGLNTASAIRLIKGANVGVSVPYTVGAKVQIPKYHQAKNIRAHFGSTTLEQIARKNSSTPGEIKALNPTLHFPVTVGTQVRIA